MPASNEMLEYIKNRCEHDLQEIEIYEPYNERLIENVKSYYNGYLKQKTFSAITRQEFERLKQIGLDKIVFDWQALEETVDNELMGRKGSNTYLMDSLIRASTIGLNVDVHFIPMKPNYKQFPDIIECLKIANIKNISVLNFVPQGRGQENREKLMLNDKELKEFSEILKTENEHYSGNIRIGIPLDGRISHLYTAGTEKLDIMNRLSDENMFPHTTLVIFENVYYLGKSNSFYKKEGYMLNAKKQISKSIIYSKKLIK